MLATSLKVPVSSAMLGMPPVAVTERSRANPSSTRTKTPRTVIEKTRRPRGPICNSPAAKMVTCSVLVSSEKTPLIRAISKSVPGRLKARSPSALMSTSPASIVMGSSSSLSVSGTIVRSTSVVLITISALAKTLIPMALSAGTLKSRVNAATNPFLVISRYPVAVSLPISLRTIPPSA